MHTREKFFPGKIVVVEGYLGKVVKLDHREPNNDRYWGLYFEDGGVFTFDPRRGLYLDRKQAPERLVEEGDLVYFSHHSSHARHVRGWGFASTYAAAFRTQAQEQH